MKKLISVLALSIAAAGSAFARSPLAMLVDQASSSMHTSSARAPEGQVIENAFSPNEGAEALVLKVINASQHSIRLSGYSFTSVPVVRALVAAKKRGVDVRVVVDEKNNLHESGRGRANKAIAALNLLVNADIPARTISVYAIHHDKFVISDQRHVETGSFNYSAAAEKANSENVLVVWNNPQLAASYLKHWESRFAQGRDYHSSY